MRVRTQQNAEATFRRGPSHGKSRQGHVKLDGRRRMRRFIAAIAAAAGCLLVPPTLLTPLTTPLHAQEARGTIQGRVSDESGAVVPGAAVEVANTATGLATSTTSNDEGNYRVPFLIPGTYRVTVTLDGFSKFV